MSAIDAEQMLETGIAIGNTIAYGTPGNFKATPGAPPAVLIGAKGGTVSYPGGQVVHYHRGFLYHLTTAQQATLTAAGIAFTVQ